ncbi:hypothetical protein [Natronoglomus mannanivorans]|uniref:Uncharacterized protein n=1 Tax=Natronoglomus mannanivorans TaxID=2979990 RepID=A0AAP3E4M5_9EURY|nr:hypothetical protein [Halobacteria archaeon AArc-xg1-1]
MVREHPLQHVSLAMFACAIAASIGVGGTLLTDTLSGTTVFDEVLLDLHYFLMNGFFIVAVSLLFVGYYHYQRLVLLVAGLALSGWTLAHLYWTLYVYLASVPITYPSVADLGFQAFHLLILPTLLYLHRRADIRVRRSVVGVVIAAPLLLAVVTIGQTIPIGRFVYSLWYIILAAASLAIATNLLLSHRFRGIAIGVALFAVSDITYTTIAIVTPRLTVEFLDPVWYVSATLIAASLLRYEQEGRLQ